MIWPVIKMILALGVVLVLMFAIIRILRRTDLIKSDFSSDIGIRIVTTKPIAPRKVIALVEIGGEVLALGISESQINFLTKVENREFLEKLASSASARSQSPRDLSWSHFLPKRPGKFQRKQREPHGR